MVKELRLKNISSIEEANIYLSEYIEKHNMQFSVEAKKSENLHEKMEKERIVNAFKYKEERVLSKNLELSYCNRIVQIQTERPTYATRRAKVLVIKDLSRNIEIEFQGKKLSYKELLVKDRQRKILNKKEVAARNFPPREKGVALNF